MAIAAGTAANTGREVLDLMRLEKFKPALEKLTGPDIVGKYVPSATDFNNIDAFANVFRSLGVTPETADEDIAFAYECQIRTDPKHLPYYLDSLAQVAQLRGDHREALQMLIATERSQDRFGHTEVVAALAKLNLHPIPDPERTFFNNPVHTLPNEELIAAAYQEGKDRVPIQQGTESDLKELKDAVAVLSKVLQSDYLKVLLDSTMPSKPSVNDITLEESWTYLQVTTDIADDMICSAVSIMFVSFGVRSRH